MNTTRVIQVPTYYEVKDRPQSAQLAALDLAITLAEHALRNAHSMAGYTQSPGDEPPVELARAIMGRCAELRGLIPAYCAVVRNHKPQTDDTIF